MLHEIHLDVVWRVVWEGWKCLGSVENETLRHRREHLQMRDYAGSTSSRAEAEISVMVRMKDDASLQSLLIDAFDPVTSRVTTANVTSTDHYYTRLYRTGLSSVDCAYCRTE